MSFPARLAFIGLWQQADREGRLRDRPVRLKARIFPYDELDFEALLQEMIAKNFVVRYEVNGHQYLFVRTLVKHQTINPNEAKSVLPAPPFEMNDQDRSGDLLFSQERKGKEGNREGKGTEESFALHGSAQPVLVFPTVGTGPKSWALTDAQIAEWQACYPGIDVGSECRKALAWVQANQPKTAKGMPAFLVNWLNRAVDSGRAAKLPAQAPRRVPWHHDACPHTPKCGTMRECSDRKHAERTKAS